MEELHVDGWKEPHDHIVAVQWALSKLQCTYMKPNYTLLGYFAVIENEVILI